MELKIRAENQRKDNELKETEQKRKRKELEISAKEDEEQDRIRQAIISAQAAAAAIHSTHSVEQMGGDPESEGVSDEELLESLPEGVSSNTEVEQEVPRNLNSPAPIVDSSALLCGLRVRDFMSQYEKLKREKLGALPSLTKSLPLYLIVGTGSGCLAIEYHPQPLSSTSDGQKGGKG